MPSDVLEMKRSVRCFGNIDIAIGDKLHILSPEDSTKPESDEMPSGFNRMFRIMSPLDGDRRVCWNKYSIAEINEAKKLFRELINQGMVPYLVDTSTGKRSTKPVQKFEDALHLEEIIFSDVVPEAEVVFVPKKAIVGG